MLIEEMDLSMQDTDILKVFDMLGGELFSEMSGGDPPQYRRGVTVKKVSVISIVFIFFYLGPDVAMLKT